MDGPNTIAARQRLKEVAPYNVPEYLIALVLSLSELMDKRPAASTAKELAAVWERIEKHVAENDDEDWANIVKQLKA